MTRLREFNKRSFDLFFSALGLLACGWLIGLAWLVAAVETGGGGFYTQSRVGRHGKLFRIVKIKTMRDRAEPGSTVTTSRDLRLTRSGALFRKLKLDELPQLFNVLVGDMSFVGPRPDVPGFADKLTGDDREVLTVRPGITGPATLKFRDEEELLARQPDPEAYNRDVLFPEKVRLNREYVRAYGLLSDIRWIVQTLLPGGQRC